MNISWKNQCLLLFAIICLVACGNEPKDTNDNPVYQHPSIKAFSAEISDKPRNADLYYKRGNALKNIQEDSLALIDYKKAVSLDSTKSEYFSAIGDILFEHKDIGGSQQWIAKAIQLNPKDPAAHLKIAKLFIYIKEYKKAFEEINIVLRQDVYNAEGYFLKGVMYKELKDTSHAISSFQTAVQVAPQYRDAVIQLGIMYSMKQDKLALQYYDNAYRLDTTDVFPMYAKGVYYQDMKDYEAAKTEYRKAIVNDRNYTDAYFNMGYVLMQQDSNEKAWRQFNLVIQLEPNDAEAYYNRGLCSELMGKKQDAIADYNQALSFDKTYDEPKAGLARLSK